MQQAILPHPAGVVVTLNNDLQLPTVTITAPSAGTVTGTLTITSNAADNVGVNRRTVFIRRS